MLKNAMMLSMIFLASCNSIERKAICKEINQTAYTLKPLYDINIQELRCRARCYNWDAQESVSLKECKELEADMMKHPVEVDKATGDEVVVLPLMRCHNIAGFSIKDIGLDIKPKTLRRAAIMEDKCL